MTIGVAVVERSEATKQTTLLSLRTWTLKRSGSQSRIFRGRIVIHSIKYRFAFANTVRKPKVCEARLPRFPEGKPRNDSWLDCHCEERSDEAISFSNPLSWRMCWRSNLVLQPFELENVLAKPISFSNPLSWRMCWRSNLVLQPFELENVLAKPISFSNPLSWRMCWRSNLVLQPFELENVLAKPISFSNPLSWRMCWRSQSRIESATACLTGSLAIQKGWIATPAFGGLTSMGIGF